MEKKVLSIHAAVCDARKVQESSLSAYERIEIYAALLLVSRETRPLLDQYQVKLSAAQVMELDAEAKIASVNGKMQLQPGQAAPEQTLLMVNGKLDIAPGSEEVLKSYTGIIVNGSVSCPESMAPLLAMARVNGAIETYPDGCIRLKRRAVLDRSFHLRAKQDAFYYAARQITALAPDIRWDVLAEKHVRFATQTLLLAEGQAEAALPLFDDQTDIVLLPDGCAYVEDDAVLNKALLQQHGGKLYIEGNLVVGRDSAPWLGQVSYLHVTGDLLVARGLAEAVQAIHPVYRRLRVVAGTLVSGKTAVTVDRAMLEAAEDGLSLFDCVNVTFREDIPAGLLQERLAGLEDCVNVTCTPEQRAAVEMAAHDVVRITDTCQEEADAGSPAGNVVKSACYVL